MSSPRVFGVVAGSFAVWFACLGAILPQLVGSALAQSGHEVIDPIARIVERLERTVRDYTIAGFMGALLVLVGTLVGHRLTWMVGRAQRRQQRDLAYEAQTMSLVAQLGDKSPPVRIASATLLFDRLRRFEGRSRWRRNRPTHEQGKMLQVLVSVTKEDKPDPNLAKVIGDELVGLLQAQVAKGWRPAAGSSSPMRAFQGTTLDLQYVKFPNAYWPRVDARGVDFFGADFTRAGLREAFLEGTIFRSGSLKSSVLCDADLRGADLRGADLTGADLEGANLKGAKADRTTVWPDNFDLKRLSV